MYKGGIEVNFVFEVQYEDKDKAKEYGMYWNKYKRCWCRRYYGIIPLESEYIELVDKHRNMFEVFKVLDIEQGGFACFDFKDDIVKYCASCYEDNTKFNAKLSWLNRRCVAAAATDSDDDDDDDDDDEQYSDSDYESDSIGYERDYDRKQFARKLRLKKYTPYSMIYS
jgi:hypothetical protein